MKIITFNSIGQPNNTKSYINILDMSSDFEYFKIIHLKLNRSRFLAWWSYEYTIEDDLANFLKMKYPGMVSIKEWTKW